MDTQKQIDSHLNVILDNMCRYVEANYWDIDFINGVKRMNNILKSG